MILNIYNQIGNYGQQGISYSSNIPGARYGSVSWIDNNNYLWLFGGNTAGYNCMNNIYNEIIIYLFFRISKWLVEIWWK